MGVAHGRIRPQQRLLLANPGAELLRAEFLEFIAGARGQRSGSVQLRNLCRNPPRGARLVFNTSVAIDDHVTDVLQQLSRTISSRRELKQSRRLVNESRRAV